MKKKKGRKKKTLPLKTILLISTAFLTGIFLWVIYGIFSDNQNGVLPFLYEEIYSSSEELNETIKHVDASLYESFYKGGVQEKDVFFLNVYPMHRNGHVWDFAEMLVRCKDKHLALKLRKIIHQGVVSLGKGVTLETETGSKGSITCYIASQNIRTHKVILSVDGHRPSTKDARPRIAIIIDDLGYDYKVDCSFLLLDLALSYSVLPHGPFTQSIVKEVNKAGGELILHLPMEPKNYPSVKPGPGALFLSMEEHQIRQVLEQDLMQIRGVRGVNNHMGSAYTEDEEKMRIVLKELKKRGLFFIDSRTTKNTTAFDMAKNIGVLAARRRVFLDNNLDPAAMKIQMERLINMARHQGEAIGIGHPYIETYELLDRYRKKLKSEFLIVPVSELVS